MAGITLKRMDRKTTVSRELVRKIVKEVFAEDKQPKDKKELKTGDSDKLGKVG